MGGGLVSLLFHVQNNGSPHIKLTTLLVSEEWAIFDYVYSWECRADNWNNFPPVQPPDPFNAAAERKNDEKGRR